MSFPRARLYATSALFIAWLGYLAFLAFNYRHPMVVSRSQFMAADSIVVVDVSYDANGLAMDDVSLVEWLKGAESPKKLRVAGLKDALPPTKEPVAEARHLLFLRTLPEGGYQVAETPPAPGDGVTRRYVYPWTPEVERQVRGMLR